MRSEKSRSIIPISSMSPCAASSMVDSKREKMTSVGEK